MDTPERENTPVSETLPCDTEPAEAQDGFLDKFNAIPGLVRQRILDALLDRCLSQFLESAPTLPDPRAAAIAAANDAQRVHEPLCEASVRRFTRP